MSRTTAVLVYLNSEAGDFPTAEREALTEPFGDHTPLYLIDTDHVVGDGKGFTGAVYAGAFNYLRVDEFIGWFWALPWDDDTGVVAVIDDEHEPLIVLRRASGSPTWSAKGLRE